MLWDQLPNNAMAIQADKTKAIQDNLQKKHQEPKKAKQPMKGTTAATKSQAMKAMKAMKTTKDK